MIRLVSLLPTREVIHLLTTFERAPIPERNFDWLAVDSNTFDADYDYASGRYVSSSPAGSGATEAEAISDLFDQMEPEIEKVFPAVVPHNKTGLHCDDSRPRVVRPGPAFGGH